MNHKKLNELLILFDKTSDLLSITKQELKKFDEKYKKNPLTPILKTNGTKMV